MQSIFGRWKARRRIWKLLDGQEYSKALPLLRCFVAESRKPTEEHLRLGYCEAVVEGDSHELERLCQECRGHLGEDNILLTEGTGKIDAGRVDEGLVLVQRAAELNVAMKPRSNRLDPVYVQVTLGASLYMGEQYREAISVFNRVLAKDPKNVCALAGAALAYQQCGDYENTERLCRQALKIDPSHGRAHCGLGAAYNQQYRFLDAARHFRLAAELSPVDVVWGHTNAAIALLAARKVDEALCTAQKAVAADDTDVLAREVLAAIEESPSGDILDLFDSHRYRDVLPKLRVAVENAARPGLAHLYLAYCEAAINDDLAKMEQLCGQCDGLVADDYILLIRGMARFDCGITEDGLDLMRKALRKNLSKDTFVADSRRMDYYSELGNRLMQSGLYEEALALYREVIDRPTFHPNALCECATCSLELGRPGEARAYLDEVMKVEPMNAEAHFRMAQWLQTTGDFCEAANEYAIAIDCGHRDTAIARAAIAYCLLEAGHMKEAREALAEAIELDPDNEYVKEIALDVASRTGDPSSDR